ncbi:hypothetical protein ACA910_000105 [Epithemia clementina (nom. ined.)]
MIGLQLPVVVVEALCSVSNHNGQPLSLTKSNVLPSGVHYDAVADRLTCHGPNSCHRWSISDCFELDCVGSRACQATQLKRNSHVICRGFAACQESQLQQVHTVVCTGGTDSLHTCHGATVQTNWLVTCLGPQACVGGLSLPSTSTTTSKNAKTTTTTSENNNHNNQNNHNDQKTILQLGASGVVKCTGGQGIRSCQNLVVQINHARRACFRDPFVVPNADTKVKSLDQPQPEHCAVICDNAETECDFPSIDFYVVVPP